MTDLLIVTEPDGSKWVSLEDYEHLQAALDWALATGAGIGAHGLARFNERGEVEALDAPEHLKDLVDASVERFIALSAMSDEETPLRLADAIAMARDPNHKHVYKDGGYGAAICESCTHMADEWYCPASPDHLCHYDKGNPDQCDYCGQPEERK